MRAACLMMSGSGVNRINVLDVHARGVRQGWRAADLGDWKNSHWGLIEMSILIPL
jgi:hypothetical protein